jgi:hypothetical protein
VRLTFFFHRDFVLPFCGIVLPFFAYADWSHST